MEKKNIKESLNGNTFASEKNMYNSELISVNNVKGTPFNIVKIAGDGDIEDDEYFIAVGNHRLTDLTPFKEDLLKKIEERDWDLITTLMFATIKGMELYTKQHDKMAEEGQDLGQVQNQI